MKAGDVHLAFHTGDAYLMPLTVALTTALRNLRECGTVHVWLVDHGLSAASWHRLEQAVERSGRVGVEIHRLRMSVSEVAHLAGPHHPAVAAFLKLLLVDLLPGDATSVVVLDCDVVVRRDISALTRVEFGGAALAGVRDAALATTGSPYCSAACAPGDPGDRPYFNSGVIAINLPRWRAESVGERALVYAERHGPLALVDQDALNAVAGPWHELPLHYNLQTYALHPLPRLRGPVETNARVPSHADLEAAAIVHYAGRDKPWVAGYRGVGGALWLQEARDAGAFESMPPSI